MEVLVGLGDVRDLAVLAVVIDPLALARAECDHSQQHGLGERPGILERTRGLRASPDRIDPVHPVLRRPLGSVRGLDWRMGLRHAPRFLHQRRGVQRGLARHKSRGGGCPSRRSR